MLTFGGGSLPWIWDWKATLPADALPPKIGLCCPQKIVNCEQPLDPRLLKMCVLSVVSWFLSSVWYWMTFPYGWVKKNAIFLLKCPCKYSLFLHRNSIRDFRFIAACTYYYSNFTSQELRFHEVLGRVYRVKIAPNNIALAPEPFPLCFISWNLFLGKGDPFLLN